MLRCELPRSTAWAVSALPPGNTAISSDSFGAIFTVVGAADSASHSNSVRVPAQSSAEACASAERTVVRTIRPAGFANVHSTA